MNVGSNNDGVGCRDGYAGEDLFRASEESIRANSKTFYFATALLPPARRRAIRALYAFCRATDDLVDLGRATDAEMEAWRRKVKLPAEKQYDPILYAWALTRERYAANPRYEDELIAGVSLDISPRVYKTWEELESYCYQVASTVGLLAMPIIGLRGGWRFEQAAPYAIRLGIALQLTNILRDVGEDAGRGQVYLPEVDLARFGLTRAGILAGVHDERFVALMKFEIERARRIYAEALPGISLLSPGGQAAVGAAALLYRAILDEIEAIGYRVHQVRARITGAKKLALLPGILLSILRLKPPRQEEPRQYTFIRL
ncbi:MAG TPA: squalene/phytoene synthase family protein [Anaerolineaceae bacterium]|nr:squalene/phytoene synthase family protein [Anaerolineaceae bacterium]